MLSPGEVMTGSNQSTMEYWIDSLANGIRVVGVPAAHLHSLELVCYLGVGGRCEPSQQAGISHLLEHMLFRGTTEYAGSLELEQAFEALGGAVNASTDMETTCFHSRLHPECLAAGVALFASMLRRPTFSGLKTEKRIVLEEALEDFNEAGCQINPDNLMMPLLWPGHPLGKSLIGTPESLAGIDQAQLTDYYRDWYQPANLVICASGPLRREALSAAVDQEFGSWSGSALPELNPAPETDSTTPETCWVRDSASQISLQLAFPLPGRNDAGTLAVRLLRRILAWGGSARLNRRLREELGLTYAVDAGCSLLSDTGYLAVELAVAPDNLYRALAELLDVLDELRRAPVPAEEIAAVVRGYLFDLEFARDQNEALALRYGWGVQAGYLRTLEQDARELRQLDAAAVQQAALQVFRRQTLKLVVVGPWDRRERLRVDRLLQNW